MSVHRSALARVWPVEEEAKRLGIPVRLAKLPSSKVCIAGDNETRLP
jgi:hypothetical protein